MNIITLARYGAILAFLVTFGMLASDGFRSDQLFFYPALILCGFLLIAAFSPKRFAPALLLASFSYATSMYVAETVLASWEGRTLIALILGVLGSVFGMVLMVRYIMKNSKL